MDRWTIWIDLKDLDCINRLCAICEKFRYMDIDVRCNGDTVKWRYCKWKKRIGSSIIFTS